MSEKQDELTHFISYLQNLNFGSTDNAYMITNRYNANTEGRRISSGLLHSA